MKTGTQPFKKFKQSVISWQLLLHSDINLTLQVMVVPTPCMVWNGDAFSDSGSERVMGFWASTDIVNMGSEQTENPPKLGQERWI